MILVTYGPWEFNEAKGYWFRKCSFPAGAHQYLILFPSKPEWVYWFNPKGPSGPVFWCACPTALHPTFGDDVRNGKALFLNAAEKSKSISGTVFPDDDGANFKASATAKDADGSPVDLGTPPDDLPDGINEDDRP